MDVTETTPYTYNAVGSLAKITYANGNYATYTYDSLNRLTANKIIAVLKYPTLKIILQNHGNFEVSKLRWKDSAAKCAKIYEKILAAL